jgi:hypothetical protein
MNKEQEELVDEVYNKYTNKYVGYDDVPSKELFLFEIKNNPEFSERWGLKIEERELGLEERRELSPNSKTTDIFKDLSIDFNPNVKMGCWNDQMSLEDFSDDIKQEIRRSYNKENIPTKQITITYNDQTIESYE